MSSKNFLDMIKHKTHKQDLKIQKITLQTHPIKNAENQRCRKDSLKSHLEKKQKNKPKKDKGENQQQNETETKNRNAKFFNLSLSHQ